MENITALYRSLLPEDLHVAMGAIGRQYSAGLLSPPEREEYRQISHQRRRDEFLTTRGLIKELVGEMGLDQTVFEIQKDGFGKPFGIYSNARYHLSLAHTSEKVVCGISPTLPVGVDIEPVGRTVAERLRRRILHDEERALLADQPIVRIWTLKEAMVKLEGKGLRTNLNKLKLQVESDRLFTGFFADDKTAIICSLRHRNHWVAVAYYSRG
ncbi:4'-phosphopantetheinyl transferase family protein [Halalkalibaculum sp. DA384]|uniref:4'-phosphopantetheinyl transferase family protein n=1 Tax=Halalkalibaculum sp. DA384 TaxID=3373606 RepID=UPI0037552CB7